jgi:hypothetical protein
MTLKRRYRKAQGNSIVYNWTRQETIENAKVDGQETVVINGKTINVSTGVEVSE